MMINYSLYKTYDEDEPRQLIWKEQRDTRGFDDTETWNLDITFAKFLVPRLKVFKDRNIGYPIHLKPSEWNKILDEMIEGFEIIANETRFFSMSNEESIKVNNAVRYLGEYYFSLQW